MAGYTPFPQELRPSPKPPWLLSSLEETRESHPSGTQEECSAFSRMEKVGIYLQLKVEIPFGVLFTLAIFSVNFHCLANLTNDLVPMPYCVLC